MTDEIRRQMYDLFSSRAKAADAMLEDLRAIKAQIEAKIDAATSRANAAHRALADFEKTA